jgi:hypothetical protein
MAAELRLDWFCEGKEYDPYRRVWSGGHIAFECMVMAVSKVEHLELPSKFKLSIIA